ncbi:putative protein [Geobacter sp. OR-1]|uniref:VWA domain-containing protein n=1 Tax=Geobacter sp. OR-1 TaxID=1266765 RepID=UPI00054341E3|nr:VWA domain-containing protein [Geobacter sp. OR-1]GAM10022.1 putative protein [Geobacter sp. OR-1]
MTFHDPLALLLLLIMPIVFIIRKRRNQTAQLSFTDVQIMQGLPNTPRQQLAAMLPAARWLAIALAILALARPQLVVREKTITSRGIDMALALDISTSMLAIDRTAIAKGKPRLQIAKDVIKEFVSKRTSDRIGLVAFAARPYPVAPLTTDHQWLISAVEQLDTGAIEDGTAIGDALLAAVNRLRSSPAASRTILLITDGRNNSGAVAPAVAAQAAKALGIKVNAIGIGGKGGADFPVEDPFGGITYREVKADLDVPTLTDIARITNGRFFLADDADALRTIFKEIDRLEKQPIEEKVSNSAQELFAPFLLAAFTLLAAESLLGATWLRRMP